MESRQRMNQLLKLLAHDPAVNAILQKKNCLGNLGLQEEALLLAAAFQQKPRSYFIVKQNLYSAQKLYERLRPLLKEQVLLFAMEESLRVEAIAASPEMKAAQVETLNRILDPSAKIIITHTGACMRYLPDPESFRSHCLHIETGMCLDYDQMKQLLFEAGYQPVSRVDQPLCYASRGGIIDVFSINHEDPIRIEFFDNEIDTIRYFDIHTQRTKQLLQAVTIIPATTLLLDEEEIAQIVEKVNHQLQKQMTKEKDSSLEERINDDLDQIANHMDEPFIYRYFTYKKTNASLFDYDPHALVILSSEEEVKDAEKRIQEETIAYLQELAEEKQALATFTHFHDIHTIIAQREVITFGLFLNFKDPISSGIVSVTPPDLIFEKIMEEISLTAKKQTVLLSVNEKHKEQIKQYLNEHLIPYQEIDEESPFTSGISFYPGIFGEGFSLAEEQIVCYSDKELFHEKVKLGRYHNKFKEAEVLHNYMELEIGDYIVHNQHGIGQYMGIVTRENDGVHKDFLHIIYKGNDELFVPLEQFKLVRKFVSKEGARPKLNKLGSGDWEKTKKRISENIKELAERLIHLYAVREEHIGHAFSKDSVFQRQFEEDFPYELTADQEKAVKEIKADMELDKPMDRLLCGDVGFGKTEVAIRAAFKAVIDEKQVAFLCPTTILSQQHYHTFRKRFENYPVQIAVLNRYVEPSLQKKIIQDVKAGKIDILIGTHRILSKDVSFHDLGLLVIDEEQRFGVEHKEKIKELKNSIDVLSLSATPIPRTLQMSLIGIRALSQLDTPPQNRMPVQTYVIEKNMHVIKEVIERELVREGQVFYLYNNVKEIYQVAAKLKELMPDTTIGVAHGQMQREEIEDVMMRFIDNAYQVLVCTTIIETGIDIPNANTIIIDQADRFGLSQLYQIKGRVGRSDRLAYAYLMYSPQKQMSEIAMKRLKSIKEFTQLGSGYKVAMRDLTIRGAGDMLGAKQAGFIDTVGIDMYIEMLNEAIQEQKGIIKEELPQIKKANAKLDAYIPQQFAPEDMEKITLYQRMDTLKTKADLLAMQEEIKDNYGRLPKSVQLLFEKKRLEILINEPHVFRFQENERNILLEFDEAWSAQVDGVALFERMTTISRDIKIRYAEKRIKMNLTKTKEWLSVVIEILEACEKQ